jgi:hypothetical protein
MKADPNAKKSAKKHCTGPRSPHGVHTDTTLELDPMRYFEQEQYLHNLPLGKTDH